MEEEEEVGGGDGLGGCGGLDYIMALLPLVAEKEGGGGGKSWKS